MNYPSNPTRIAPLAAIAIPIIFFLSAPMLCSQILFLQNGFADQADNSGLASVQLSTTTSRGFFFNVDDALTLGSITVRGDYGHISGTPFPTPSAEDFYIRLYNDDIFYADLEFNDPTRTQVGERTYGPATTSPVYIYEYDLVLGSSLLLNPGEYYIALVYESGTRNWFWTSSSGSPGNDSYLSRANSIDGALNGPHTIYAGSHLDAKFYTAVPESSSIALYIGSLALMFTYLMQRKVSNKSIETTI